MANQTRSPRWERIPGGPCARWVELVAMGLVLIAGPTGCQRGVSHVDAARTSGQPPVRATTVKPPRKTLTRVIDLPGRCEPYEVTPLHARVTGYAQHVAVDLGDTIRGPKDDEPGTTLCELLVPELEEEHAEKAATVVQAKAGLEQAQAQVKVAEAALHAAEARVREAEAAIAKERARLQRWDSEYQRVAQLAQTGAVTKKVADEALAERDAAEAAKREAEARVASVESSRLQAVASLDKAQADVAAAVALIGVAEAAQRRVAAMLDYAALRAPFDGIVVERRVHTGHLVMAGSGAAAPPFVVMRTDPIRILVDVPETDAVYIAPGSRVEIRVPSVPGLAASSTVTRTSWSLHNTSRTLTVAIDLANPDRRWRPGLYVQVQLTVATRDDALSLPKPAILTQDKQPLCLVVDSSGKVVRRPISLGIQAGTDFEILTGLVGDEDVISTNPQVFREGQVVERATPPDSAPSGK